MAELFLAQHLPFARVAFRPLPNVGLNQGMYGGRDRVTDLGGQRMYATLDASIQRDADARKLIATVAGLRGALNTLWCHNHGYVRAGSFPASELLSNNTFGSGTTGWTKFSATDHAVADRVLRASRNANSGVTQSLLQPTPDVTVTPFVPYAWRVHLASRKYVAPTCLDVQTASDVTFAQTATGTVGHVLLTLAFVPPSTPVSPRLIDASPVTGLIAGDYVDVDYTSLSRCALADNGPNGFVQSRAADNAEWTKDDLTVTANDQTNYDGTATADTLVEDTDNSDHFLANNTSFTVPSTACDIFLGFVIKRRGRTFCAVQLVEATGGTIVNQYFNLTTGALGTTSATGANWANLRAGVVPFGNDFFYCWIIARKTNAATSITGQLYAASADGTASYTGSGTAALTFGEGVIALSSVPVRPTTTTGSASSGTAQQGTQINLKGLPANTNGLLLEGDVVEIMGQPVWVMSPLNSDAAGLGTLHIAWPLLQEAPDNTPVIIQNPMGQFRTPEGSPEWEHLPGRIVSGVQFTLRQV